jgi:uncharacterized protein
MFDEDVETLKQAIKAHNRRDLETLLELFHPEAEVVSSPQGPLGHNVYHGRDGAAEYFGITWELWEEGSRTEVEDFVEAGDKIVGLLHFRGRGKGSGVSFESPLAYVWTLRDGKTLRMESYIGPEAHADALGAAGATAKPEKSNQP